MLIKRTERQARRGALAAALQGQSAGLDRRRVINGAQALARNTPGRPSGSVPAGQISCGDFGRFRMIRGVRWAAHESGGLKSLRRSDEGRCIQRRG